MNITTEQKQLIQEMQEMSLLTHKITLNKAIVNEHNKQIDNKVDMFESKFWYSIFDVADDKQREQLRIANIWPLFYPEHIQAIEKELVKAYERLVIIFELITGVKYNKTGLELFRELEKRGITNRKVVA